MVTFILCCSKNGWLSLTPIILIVNVATADLGGVPLSAANRRTDINPVSSASLSTGPIVHWWGHLELVVVVLHQTTLFLNDKNKTIVTMCYWTRRITFVIARKNCRTTLYILMPPKCIIWQTVKAQIKCCIIRYFISIYTVCFDKNNFHKRNTFLCKNYNLWLISVYNGLS